MVSRQGPCDTNRLRALLDWPPEEEGVACELATHLEQCEKCRKELDILAGGRWWNEVRPLVAAGAVGTALPTQPHEGVVADDPTLGFLTPVDEPGQLGRFGAYQVLGVHRGGMGVVLEAWDPTLRRKVAVKVLAPQLATSGAARQRFAREAVAAAAVVHHHVVAIHAVSTDKASGLPYLVMPYIAGRSLQERIDRDGPLEPAAVLRIGLQAAQGLAAAHAQGIVHRDVKPANILLENGVERVVLTDFGLARAADDASVTQSGVIAGTPQYMSPEQTRGEAVGPPSDLFSLGSVLYAMCTGRPPFRAPNTMAVLRRVSDEKARPVREVNPSVPAPLAALIAKLHSKKPGGRPASAAAVAAELERQLATLQAPPGQPTPPAPAARHPRRRAVLAGVALLLALLGGVFVAASRHNDQDPLRMVPLGEGGPSSLAGVGPNDTRDHVLRLDEEGRAFPPFTVTVPAPVPVAIAAVPGVSPMPPDPLVFAGEWGKLYASLQSEGGMAVVVALGKPRETIVGSGKPATKEFPLKDFTAVEIRGPFAVELHQGKEFRVSVTADDNLLDHLQVEKEGAKLVVRLAGKNLNLRFSGKDALKAAVTLPLLEGLRLEGAVRATADGFVSDRPFELAARGACRLNGSVRAGELKVTASGASAVTLSGSGKEPRLKAEGASRIKLADFTATGDKLFVEASAASFVSLKGTIKAGVIHAEGASHIDLDATSLNAADVKLSGASNAKVQVKELLDYSLDGASHLRYRGEPKSVKGHKGGASGVSRAK